MKLLNQSLWYISSSIFIIISIWSVIFYINIIDEIKDGVDDNLEDQKVSIIHSISTKHTLPLEQNPSQNYTIEKLSISGTANYEDVYYDTIVSFQETDGEIEIGPARVLETVVAHNSNYYKLKITTSMVDQEDLIHALLWDMVWLYLSLIISIICINNFIIRRLWQPFYKYLNQLKLFKLHKQTPLAPINTPIKEFKDLEQAVNQLINHSINTYNQQKQFIDNAAHELQTPLAIITNRLELLLEQEHINSEMAQEIAKILNNVNRLAKLNKSLGLLTKIEHQQYTDTQSITINTLIKSTAEELAYLSEHKNISINIEEKGVLNLTMDPVLADSMVKNIFRNAVFHNKTEGSINISISTNQFYIANTSDQPAITSTQLFSRFYKSNSKGTGLGLSIVQAICTTYNLDCSYSYQNHQHHFTVAKKN